MLEDAALCKEQILSEDFRDFIYERENPYFLEQISTSRVCEQEIGFYYRAIYINKIFGDPVSLERFRYGSIPKCYTLLGTETLNQAGITQVQNYPTLRLKGEGVMIGIIDTGIDYENPLFRNADGTTRIAGIWDQTIQTGREPEGFLYGSEYVREEIDEALRSDNPKEIVPTTDTDGHGTFVASIAGGGENVEEDFLGAAPRATFGIVKLKEAKNYLKQFYFINEDAKCYQENDIMLAAAYLRSLRIKYDMPLVIVLGLGSANGDRAGGTPGARFLSDLGKYIGECVVGIVGKFPGYFFGRIYFSIGRKHSKNPLKKGHK